MFTYNITYRLISLSSKICNMMFTIDHKVDRNDFTSFKDTIKNVELEKTKDKYLAVHLLAVSKIN